MIQTDEFGVDVQRVTQHLGMRWGTLMGAVCRAMIK